MNPDPRTLLAGLLTVLSSSPAAAQAPDTAGHRVSISGYVTASYTYSTQPAGSAIVGRLFGRKHDQFMVNMANLTFERVAPTDAYGGGFRFEALFGQNAAVVKSAGLDLGNEGDVWQAYVTLNTPVGNGRYLQLRAGKMATLMGLEGVEDVANPNLDVGAQDIFAEPFTETGVQLDARVISHLDVQLRVSNGWDLVQDNNQAKTLMLRIGITPDDQTSIGLLGYSGPEQAGNIHNKRSGAELLISRTITAASHGWFQFDYGQEDGIVSGGTARWYVAGLWLTYDVGSHMTLGLRGDYANDRDGARTSGVLGFPVNGGQKFGGATATLTIKRWQNVLLRPEVRYDRSSLPAFGGKRDQLTLATGLSYLF
jgi:hypothetical protein